MHRDTTKEIQIGKVKIGRGNPIAIQSMTNTKTSDVDSTVQQILSLEEEGCDIIRVTVPDMESAGAISRIKSKIHTPVVADIHFDYRLAIAACENGADKIRINPGNIGKLEEIEKIVDVCKERTIPIRVGINGGSVEKNLLAKHNGCIEDAVVESAINNIKIIENFNYDNIVVSIKMSDVKNSIQAHKLISEKINYPIHVGITESGTLKSGTINSCIGIGAILSEGIGDTIRVSLSADPIEEVRLAKDILNSLELRNDKVKIISCPTCGRTNINIIDLANEVEDKTRHIKKPIKIAVMGCVVNGPGEARECDIGIAGGIGEGLLFKKGEIIKKVKESEIVSELLKEIDRL